jgi:Asp-tRNA(Asn)/Glu-tRNA(Gln) amidotransferase A subunit family amidase
MQKNQPHATPSAAAKPAPAARRDPADLAFMSVRQLAELVRTRQISPLEITKLFLDRCRTYDSRLHCIVTLTDQFALEQAKAAESEIMKGRYRGPLHGIPWGAKDLLATRGIPTTWGAKPYENQVFDYDATVVDRLHRAGAILIAMLSMGELAQGPRWFRETTRNPWDTTRASSGSSAGPGAATSAGLVAFSIGTETLGSIISPASTCGVVGLRPTFGRVSRHGAMALSWSMDKIGPMCRGVSDCALVLKAIQGPDGQDPTVADAPFRWNPAAPIAGLRVGYVKAE